VRQTGVGLEDALEARDLGAAADEPGSVFTPESCEQMKGAQHSYQQALNDPSASRPGDEARLTQLANSHHCKGS
jgi:hypothetical protein